MIAWFIIGYCLVSLATFRLKFAQQNEYWYNWKKNHPDDYHGDADPWGPALFWGILWPLVFTGQLLRLFGLGLGKVLFPNGIKPPSQRRDEELERRKQFQEKFQENLKLGQRLVEEGEPDATA